MGLRDKNDQISASLANSLTRLLAVHKLASSAQEARLALGIGDLALQDREFVDLRGGHATFDELRIIKDATEGKEAVNLRTFGYLLDEAGFNAAPELPFTDTGLPQVLTAEYRTLTMSEGPSTGTDVLLWSEEHGVHWGPPVLGSASLNPDYLFGDINIVLYPFDVVFNDVPAGYIRFDNAAALNAYCATKVIFGNVNIWFKQDIAGTISIPNIMPPFSARLIQGNSVSFNDTLVVNNTRVRLDCGTFSVPVPFNSPKLEFNDCVFDSRSFFAVRERGTSSGNYLRLNRCTGRITVFGYPSASVGAEVVELNDSDVVLNVASPHDNVFREARYRTVSISNSDVLVANNVLFPGNYLDASHHLHLSVRNSVLATRTATVGIDPNYWIPEAEHSLVYNYQRVPMQLAAFGSQVMLAHLELNKEAWSANSDGTLPLGISSPVVTAIASTVAVLDLSDRGYQDAYGLPVYSPPLTVPNSVIFGLTRGSVLQVGLERPVVGATVSNGLYVDRPTLAAVHGALGYTPVDAAASTLATVVDRGAGAYSPTEAGVILMAAPIIEVRIGLGGYQL